MKKEQELMRELLDEAGIPALSFAWCQQGATHAVAFGITDTSAPKSVNTDTLFQAASLSKPVSAAIILDLVDQGKWALDKPLFEYDPFWSQELQQAPNYKTLTTRMIIGQCSGLPNWFETGAEKKFIAEHNTIFTYSGVAFDFLKQVVEKEMKQSWETLAQDFFTKVGMKTSTFKQLPAIRLGWIKNSTVTVDVATAHDEDGKPVSTTTSANSPEVPAGSLLTTGKDYITFLQYCCQNQFLRSKLLTGALSTLPPTSSKDSNIQWGLGMGVYHDTKKTITFHWGNNTGSIAFCAMDMATGDCMVGFSNSWNGTQVFQQIAEPIVGNIKPLFDWLADYCNFKDRHLQTQEHTVKIADLICSFAKEDPVHNSEEQQDTANASDMGIGSNLGK